MAVDGSSNCPPRMPLADPHTVIGETVFTLEEDRFLGSAPGGAEVVDIPPPGSRWYDRSVAHGDSEFMKIARLFSAVCLSLLLSVGPAFAVSGGLTGVENEAPWSVLIRSNSKSICSGALIAPRLVLTARHCATDQRFPASTLNVKVVKGGQTRTVVQARYPSSHDVAILVLSSAITSPKLLPLAPTPDTYTSFVNRGVTFFGWGKTSVTGSMSTVVRKTPNGAYIGASYCASFFGPTGSAACFLKTKTFAEDKVAVLPGDSGGPWVGWVNGAWVQLGIERGGISEVSPSSKGPEGGASVGALEVRTWILRNSDGAILAPKAGSIVRDPSNGASWRVDGSGYRRWIPDGRTYLCLVGQRVSVGNYPAIQIQTVPDRIGVHQSCSRSTLSTNHSLYRGDYLKSSDGRYRLHLQASDGNLVLYNNVGRPIWATNRLGGARLVLQGDGNLVVYTSAGKALWASNTVGLGGTGFVVQSDGNLVLYTSGARAVWASHTVGR